MDGWEVLEDINKLFYILVNWAIFQYKDTLLTV